MYWGEGKYFDDQHFKKKSNFDKVLSINLFDGDASALDQIDLKKSTEAEIAISIKKIIIIK